MKTAYFECAMGISGDMCLGALVDAGLPLSALRNGLKKLPIEGYTISSRRVTRAGLAASKVDVRVKEGVHVKHHHGRRWKDVRSIISRSGLPDRIKDQGLRIFRSLFEAEARVHGASYDTVHLHELGAVDCMVDIFGSLIGIDHLGIEQIYASPVNTGSGTVKTEHGVLPVPAPATIELLKGVPVYANAIPFELTTPTGAAILSGLDTIFGPLPRMIVEKVACGAGNKDVEGTPNILRLFIGVEQSSSGPSYAYDERSVVIETNIDDMNPQFYDHVMNRLFAAGALDVFLEQIIMKKGRPAVKLSIIGREEDIETLSKTVFEETTSIGLRINHVERRILDRDIRKVMLRGQTVQVKIARYGDRIMNIHPEYDDARRLAEKSGIALKQIIEELNTLVRKP